jgi:hypothetical protein
MCILMCPQLKQGYKVIVKYGLDICGDKKNSSKYNVHGWLLIVPSTKVHCT